MCFHFLWFSGKNFLFLFGAPPLAFDVVLSPSQTRPIRFVTISKQITVKFYDRIAFGTVDITSIYVWSFPENFTLETT